jgi:hypothetical protein
MKKRNLTKIKQKQNKNSQFEKQTSIPIVVRVKNLEETGW